MEFFKIGFCGQKLQLCPSVYSKVQKTLKHDCLLSFLPFYYYYTTPKGNFIQVQIENTCVVGVMNDVRTSQDVAAEEGDASDKAKRSKGSENIRVEVCYDFCCCSYLSLYFSVILDLVGLHATFQFLLYCVTENEVARRTRRDF